MPIQTFIPGQRWVSDTEPELGLGTLVEKTPRRVTLTFPASAERRTYAIGNTPLTRVKFFPGDSIENREGASLLVDSVIEQAGLFRYEATDAVGSKTLVHEQDLSDFLQFSTPRERFFAGQLDKSHWFDLRYQTLLRKQRLDTAPCLGLMGARTALLPHQLYIAHEVSRRPNPRVLLADEVGLGKTIEACLILHRQRLTGSVERALIIVPSPLLNQWFIELLRRFNLHFSLFDEERCEAIETSDQAENPFHAEQLVLCSLDLFLNDSKRRQQALEAGWDMLIVDEAHHLEWNEQQVSEPYRIVEALAGSIESVLLLTATPEQLGHAGHFARLRLLDPDRFHHLEDFEREQRAYVPVAAAVHRLQSNDPVQSIQLENLDDGEIAPLLDKIRNNKRPESQQTEARNALIELLLDRHGTGRVLFRNTRTRIKGFPEREVLPCPLALPDDYLDPLADPDIPTLCRLTPESIDRGLSGKDWWMIDPRVPWLVRLLKRIDSEKLLLICALDTTARELVAALRSLEGIQPALFCEDMSILERDRAAAWFADPDDGCQLLICSEIGSEGRNFQFARHLVLFDLPPDPDLLEQRVGRLDRIGQTRTIKIHVPYFEQSAQAVMFRWYHEGLEALGNTSPAAHETLSHLQPALHQALEEPHDTEALDLLIDTGRQLNEQVETRLHEGRDHLLELNSCRYPKASELLSEIQTMESADPLPVYLDRLLAAYGVETEDHSRNTLILRPGPRTLQGFPQLPAEGLTGTFDRATALAHEDRHFLTWEHPLVRDAMEMMLSSEQGSSTVNALTHPKLKGGSLLLELLYVVETPAPRQLRAGRYLPSATRRWVLDQHLGEHSDKLSREFLRTYQTPVKRDRARKIIEALSTHIRRMFEQGETLAKQELPSLTAQSLNTLTENHTVELARLKALQRVNASIRQEEIDALVQQEADLRRHLKSAHMRLDAMQLIVAL
ncbi:MAG: RNA polymerase-associated protein RapA [Gammaproteobacteria bacterium]|nr:RNA polymerase-associated protein RapA [Gammaproteobacteria bacterium]